MKIIIKDADEQPDKEIHRARSRRISNPGILSHRAGAAQPSYHMDVFVNPETS